MQNGCRGGHMNPVNSGVNDHTSHFVRMRAHCVTNIISLEYAGDSGLPRHPTTTTHTSSNPGSDIALVSMTTGCHRQVEPCNESCSLDRPFIETHKKSRLGSFTRHGRWARPEPWQRMFVPCDKQVHKVHPSKREGMLFE